MKKKNHSTLSFTLHLVLVSVFCLTIGHTALWADLSPDKFQQANALYEQGKYREALSAYQEMQKYGEHWKLYYNIGNCCYKEGEYLTAKIYYLRAQRLNPFEPAIDKNIEIVNKHFSDKVEVKEMDYLSKTALKVESLLSINIVSFILLAAVIVLNVFIFLMMYRGRSRFLIYAVSFSLVFVIVIGGYHIYRADKLNTRSTAVIGNQGAELRSGPGETNTILFKVNPGLKVKIIDQSRDWVHVSSSSQVAGWVEEKNLERI